jgi:hypothetical protein
MDGVFPGRDRNDPDSEPDGFSRNQSVHSVLVDIDLFLGALRIDDRWSREHAKEKQGEGESETGSCEGTVDGKRGTHETGEEFFDRT